MALTSTVYKITLEVVDIDRNYYADHDLTIACHPSETSERMMARVLVFALNAASDLELAAGMAKDDEPDMWRRDLTGAIEEWIEVGQPDEKRILKACGRARAVKLYSYHPRPELWWDAIANKVARAKRLSVFGIDARATKALGEAAMRSMTLQVTIQDSEIWIRGEGLELQVVVRQLRDS